MVIWEVTTMFYFENEARNLRKYLDSPISPLQTEIGAISIHRMLHVQDIVPLLWQCPKILGKSVVISDLNFLLKPNAFSFLCYSLFVQVNSNTQRKMGLILRFIFHLLSFRCLFQLIVFKLVPKRLGISVPKRLGPKRLGAKMVWCQNIRLRQIEIAKKNLQNLHCPYTNELLSRLSSITRLSIIKYTWTNITTEGESTYVCKYRPI